MTTGQAIATTARLWLKRGSPWMARAKHELTVFSPQMVELGLREMFEDIATNVEELDRREAPGLTFHVSRFTLCHILSGNLPNPGIVSIVIGLLAGARNVVKPATGDPMPALFVESLAVVDEKLAKRVALTSNREAYGHADIVVAYGDDETIETLRAGTRAAIARRRRRKEAGVVSVNKPSIRLLTSVPTGAFFGFGHRVSIGVVDLRQSASAAAAARDASLWDQQGCMSPQCFYVKGDAAAFAETLAAEMERFDRRWPRVELSFDDAAAIARARNEWGFRGRVWARKGTTHWTVVLDERTAWARSPLNRFVFVRPFELLAKLPQLAISTVGFAGFSLKEAVAMARADRYCSLGEMQRPSLLLTNGSRPRVGDLIA